MATTTATQVQQLYVGLLGRAADSTGLAYWTNQITTGARTLDDVRAAFVTTTEYTTGFGALTARADLVTAIYTNLFERTPTAAEVAYWVADTRPANQLVSAFLTYASAADQTVISNKTFVAQTYTDTVGTNFTAAGAKASIADVSGTVASVNTAIAAIANGTIGGLVPGVASIAAVTVAVDAKVAFATTAGAANPTFDTLNGLVAGKDGLVTQAEATTAFNVATAARALDGTATSTATNALSNANTALTLAKVGVSTAAIATYDAAIAAQKALITGFSATAAQAGPPAVPAQTAAQNAATAAATAKDAALTTLDSLLGASGAAVTYVTLAAKFDAAQGNTAGTTTFTKATLETALGAPASAGKTALIAETIKVPSAGQQAVDSLAKITALNTAQTNVNTGVTAVGATYDTAAKNQATASELVTKLVALDTAVTTAKAVTDQYNTLDANVASAKAALEVFKAANVDKVSLVDVAATTGTIQATAKSDVFYFGAKASATADFAVGGTTNFGVGDSIVLGSGYTYNSGALSTGNSNTLEFFLVKGATGTQVVIETDAFANANNVVGADGTISASPSATVINLVGVTADHLAVANGVISYV